MTEWRPILQELMKRAALATKTRHPSREALMDYLQKLAEEQHGGSGIEDLEDLGAKHADENFDYAQREPVWQAMKDYTAGSSGRMNDVYRKASKERTSGMSDYVRNEYENKSDALERLMLPAPKDLVVYRGLQKNSKTAERLRPNDYSFTPRHDRYGTEGFVSTSLNPDTAHNWAGGNDALAYRILVPKGAPIFPALGHSSNPSEREIILKAGNNNYQRIDPIGPKLAAEPRPSDYGKIGQEISWIDKPYKDNYNDIHDNDQYVYDFNRAMQKQDAIEQQKGILAKHFKPTSIRASDEYYDGTGKLNAEKNKLSSSVKVNDYLKASGVNMDAPAYTKGKSIRDETSESIYNAAKRAYDEKRFTNLVMSGRRGIDTPHKFASILPAAGLAGLLAKYGTKPDYGDDEQ